MQEQEDSATSGHKGCRFWEMRVMMRNWKSMRRVRRGEKGKGIAGR